MVPVAVSVAYSEQLIVTPATIGAAGRGFTVTTTGVLALTQVPDICCTKKVVVVNKPDTVYEADVDNNVPPVAALYHWNVPPVPVALSVAGELQLMVTPEAVGAGMVELTVTTTGVLALTQLPTCCAK